MLYTFNFNCFCNYVSSLVISVIATGEGIGMCGGQVFGCLDVTRVSLVDVQVNRPVQRTTCAG